MMRDGIGSEFGRALLNIQKMNRKAFAGISINRISGPFGIEPPPSFAYDFFT